MLLVDPPALIETLNPTCKRALEQAAGACFSHRHYEVTVEHFLLALVETPTSDVACILNHARLDTERMRVAIEGLLRDQKSGSERKPRFSPILTEWMQDAWVIASLERHETRLRSGVLFLRLCQAPTRYLPAELALLRELSRDELQKDFDAITKGSDEANVATNDAPHTASPEGALARFTTNLTERARNGALDPVFGREPEVRQVVDILCRHRKNNPILVGEPGVGKTALVEGLALRIVSGDVPVSLRNVELCVLDLGALQAGAGVRGEFEQRLKSVISEVKASPKPIVLFIDEAHTLIGAGGPQGGGDAANLLKPALARGELRTIAATTWSEFKRYFEKDPALERRFQPVKVDEPSIDVAIGMVRGLASRFEEAHGVVIRDEAVVAAVELSARYITGRQLPDKAVDLLDTSAARAKVLRGSMPGVLEDANAESAKLDRELAAVEREEALGHPIDETRRADLAQAKAQVAERVLALQSKLQKERTLVERIDLLRAETRDSARDALRAAIHELRQVADPLVHADVDEALVAQVVSDWTGIPAGRMVQDDVRAVTGLEARLSKRVQGQDGAIAIISRDLRAARSGLKPEGPPLGVFLLVGPSGVGKTETALGLADLLFGGERFLITINMSEFQEKHTVSRLIGSPPGYVGYGEGGKLTEAVRQRPYSVVLLDEVEKADRDVMNLFYQVFDKGILDDGEGRRINFSNTVIVMTSNLGTDHLVKLAALGEDVPSQDELVTLVKPVLTAHFKPALLARMTVVPYLPIRKSALGGIVRKKLDAVSARAKDSHGISVTFDDLVIDAIGDRCRDVDSGARNVDHILRSVILPLLSNALLQAIADERTLAALRIGLSDTGTFECTASA